MKNLAIDVFMGNPINVNLNFAEFDLNLTITRTVMHVEYLEFGEKAILDIALTDADVEEICNKLMSYPPDGESKENDTYFLGTVYEFDPNTNFSKLEINSDRPDMYNGICGYNELTDFMTFLTTKFPVIDLSKFAKDCYLSSQKIIEGNNLAERNDDLQTQIEGEKMKEEIERQVEDNNRLHEEELREQHEKEAQRDFSFGDKKERDELEQLIMKKIDANFVEVPRPEELKETNPNILENIDNDNLTLETFSKKYPSLFDEKGQFSQKGLEFIDLLIEQYAPQLIKQEEKKGQFTM
jgi:hypothetical protein